jgi:hypothetical protein
LFDRYIGIDYSGAKTPRSSLKGLRVYMADQTLPPTEVHPPPSQRKYWTRRGVAEWLIDRLAEEPTTIIGIDHGFSFPRRYFDEHHLPYDWTAFLDDFQRHWPAKEDRTYIEHIRQGQCGNGAARYGNTRWKRLTELKTRAKSVFHFDVQGSVAKSTHAGLPWLRHLRLNSRPLHFWPFDGWNVTSRRSVVAEVYPALWSRGFPREDRNQDQHDAFSVSAWMQAADADGTLANFFVPKLLPLERDSALIEGWILGIK